jgi:hypothetical protein
MNSLQPQNLHPALKILMIIGLSGSLYDWLKPKPKPKE